MRKTVSITSCLLICLTSVAFCAPEAMADSPRLTGHGNNDDPFKMSECDGGNIWDSICTSTFPDRVLDGFWSNEFVPAYQCPDSTPYLINLPFSPRIVPHGVEVVSDSIGINITGVYYHAAGKYEGKLYAGGTETNSSATNWGSGANSYRVTLHCTKDSTLSWNK